MDIKFAIGSDTGFVAETYVKLTLMGKNGKRQECAEALNQIHRIAFLRHKPIFESWFK